MAGLTATRAGPRFDLDTLRNLAGGRSFARGQAYHRDGQVELLVFEPAHVLARVTGSEDYRTELTGEGENIDGECTCQAFEDSGFCKHMVAVALTANAADGRSAAETALGRIRRHLSAKTADQLVDMIVKFAVRDDALFRELDIAAVTTSRDDATVLAGLRKAIDDVTAVNDYLHYREVRDWAGGVEAVLDRISALVAEGRGRLALSLVDHALTKIGEAIWKIDDSAGYGGGLLQAKRNFMKLLNAG